MNNFLELYEAGAILRWHTQLPIKSQDLAAHSWGVAMIIMEIAPDASQGLIKYALTHDLAERATGDIPYPVKKMNRNLMVAVEQIEYEFEDTHSIQWNLAYGEYEIFKWADMMELLLWTHREMRMGNLHMKRAYQTAVRALNEMGYPNQRAEELFRSATSMISM